MNTINELTIYEQTIKKSTFICTIIPVKSIEEVNTQLKEIKKKYYDATHNCYSYIVYDESSKQKIIKASDDGEPSQTAGVVILDVLQKYDLVNVLAVVTRYFGGIKLGAGGLVRAYSSSTSETLKNAKIIEIVNTVKLKLTFSYIYVNEITRLLHSYQLFEKNYDSSVSLTYIIPEKDYESIIASLISLTKNSLEYQLIIN